MRPARREREHGSGHGGVPEPVRQDGVAGQRQPSVLFVSYDLHANARGGPGRDAVRRLLARWSELIAGRGHGVTATVGVGPTLPPRLGIGAPDGLRELPAFPGERPEPGAGGGEIGVQICGPGPRACEALAGMLAGAGAGVLRPRWRQAGFLASGRPGAGAGFLAPPEAGGTPRDLFGFKNGTANPGPQECEHWVWLPGPGPYADGTFLVVRRIRLRVEEFGRLPVTRQEQIIGRRKQGGEPLGGGSEHDAGDLDARAQDGGYLLPADAHMRLADPRLDGGARMLRRGYSYENNAADRGTLFLAYMRDPLLFVRARQRMASGDALNAFTQPYGSALFYVLPGSRPDRPLGSTVL